MIDVPPPAQVDVRVFWMSLDTVEVAAPPTDSQFPYDRWVAQAHLAYGFSTPYTKRKRRGKRDELLFLRP